MRYPECDYCHQPQTKEAWHGSGVINGVDSRHIHACDKCRHLLPGFDVRQLKEGDVVVMSESTCSDLIYNIVHAIQQLEHKPRVLLIAGSFDIVPEHEMNAAGWYRKEQP